MRTKTLLLAFMATVLIPVIKINAQSWTLKGNAGTVPATNFIGTTDTKDFIIRTKNIQRVRVNSTGNILIGQLSTYR